MGGRGTRLWVRVAAVLIPLALTLIVLEVVVRVTGLASPDHRTVYRDTVVKGRPNASYVNRKEHRNTVRLNNFGFHDRDWNAGGDERTVLFLGDSMVEGIQVPVDSLFTSVLEDELRQDGVRVEVLNAAVSATGTGHQYLLWKTFIHDSGVRVDQVVLCLFPQNDLKNNHIDIGRGPEDYGVYLGPDGTPFVYHGRESWARSELRGLIDHSALLNLLYTRLHYLRNAGGHGDEEVASAYSATPAEPDANPMDHPDFASAGAESLWADSMRRTLRLIERWDREAAEAGQDFNVVIIPSVDTDNFFESELSRRLLEAGRRGELSVLRLRLGGLSPLETNSFDGRTVGHFNCLGHRIVAGELRDWFESRAVPGVECGSGSQVDPKPPAGEPAASSARGGDGT